MATLINGTQISNKIRASIKQQVSEMGIKPNLAVLWVGNDPASEVYVKRKTEACSEVGIESSVTWLDNDIAHKLSNTVEIFNKDPEIDGILVQLPIPKEIVRAEIFDLIDPRKDVDVFNPVNVGLLMQGRPRFLPCTPQGISLMLKHSGVPVAGKHVVVINRSDIVGKPLWSILIQNDPEFGNATVTVCHDHTPPVLLRSLCLAADIIVVAVGIPGFLTQDMVQPHQAIIDVGITRVGKKIVGDVAPEVADKVAWISPVPNGVGPLTVTSLLYNTLRAATLNGK